MTITPEKLRELASETDFGVGRRYAIALRAAADEIERLRAGVANIKESAVALRDHLARKP